MRIKIAIAFLILTYKLSYAQTQIGAQVWIEPGQTDEQIDHWFKLLGENDMQVARLFIMWNFIETTPGNWDFSLYDKAFDAAEKYGIKIQATLTTNRRAAHRGDYYQLHATKMEDTWERLEESAIYIEKIVSHWKDHPATGNWILTNEAGQRPSDHPLAVDRFKKWLEEKYQDINVLNSKWSTGFEDFESIEYNEKYWATGNNYWGSQYPYIDWYAFWRDHQSWWLEWIATEVRKIDTQHGVHSQIGAGTIYNSSVLSYDLPAWGKFSESLGMSIHPSWGFVILDRDQYPLGVSYSNDWLKGASNKPFWVTELQAGTNILSGSKPMTPTPNEIAQWTWISIGSGTEMIMYWLLNSRLAGFETGEWSMLDFQQKPLENFRVASDIARTVKENKTLFASARPIYTPITILLSLETMTQQNRKSDNSILARSIMAHKLSVLAYYEILKEMGIPVQIKHIHAFDWEAEGNGQFLILPNITSLTDEQARLLDGFINKGNDALITGFTGLYDEYTRLNSFKGFPLKNLLGAEYKTIRMLEEPASIPVNGGSSPLPATNWVGEILNYTAKVIAEQNNWVTAIENSYGKGKVTWIPSPIGVGAWTGDKQPLADFLVKLLKDYEIDFPLTFKARYPKCLMRTLKSGDEYITVISNGSNQDQTILFNKEKGLSPTVLWGSEKELIGANEIVLSEKGTIVLRWK